MAVRVAINGFGRTGRAAFRAAYESGADIEWVAINDVAEPAMLAQLLKYDTVYGPFAGTVEAVDGAIFVDGNRIVTPMAADPAAASVGRARRRRRDRVERPLPHPRRRCEASRGGSEEGDHLRAGQGAGRDASRSASTSRPTTPSCDHIISNASCTTNCLAPVAKVLHEALGIHHGVMTTVHAYTGDQQLLDGPHKDYRRARAAAANLVPTSTGAAKAIGLVVPELAGKLQGFAVRVPVLTGSLVDLTFETERATSVEEVNAVSSSSAPTAASSRASFATARSRSSRPTSSSRRTRRSSTRR